MAKAVKKIEEKSTEVAMPSGDWGDYAQQHEAAGLSRAAEDNVVPMIGIIQSNSPQLIRKHEKYLEGAMSGDIIVKGTDKGFVNGEEQGLLFQPCHFVKAWVEWQPRDDGGGYIARHQTLPADARKITRKDGKEVMGSPRGTEYVETRYHAGFLIDEETGQGLPYIIPFTGSLHQVSKEWQTLMGARRTPQGFVLPSWVGKYRIKTRMRTKGSDSWFVYSISLDSLFSSPADPQVKAGEEFHRQMVAGEMKMAAEEGASAPAADGAM